jgi:sugar phosphate isomerase/epimerase
MLMHPRVSLHQIAFLGESTAAFLAHSLAIGVGHVTLVTPKLFQPGEMDAALGELALGGVKATTMNHVFGVYPNLERDEGEAGQHLIRAIDVTAAVGGTQIYLISGGRGSLTWEEGAERFAQLLAPCLDHASAKGVRLLVENAAAMNADMHMAHTLPDAVRLAQTAGIGVCIELHACWMEGNLAELFARAVPLAGLVQASDYVLGDRTTPCRAVPGDGVIPLERLLGQLLDLGYEGLFDLELVGPRINAEGCYGATTRAAEYLSDLLTKLGA